MKGPIVFLVVIVSTFSMASNSARAQTNFLLNKSSIGCLVPAAEGNRFLDDYDLDPNTFAGVYFSGDDIESVYKPGLVNWDGKSFVIGELYSQKSFVTRGDQALVVSTLKYKYFHPSTLWGGNYLIVRLKDKRNFVLKVIQADISRKKIVSPNGKDYFPICRIESRDLDHLAKTDPMVVKQVKCDDVFCW